MTISWWLSNQRMTVKVVLRDRVIIDAAPIVRKFIGQPFQNLVGWMKRMGPPLTMQWNWLIIRDEDGNIVKKNHDFLEVPND